MSEDKGKKPRRWKKIGPGFESNYGEQITVDGTVYIALAGGTNTKSGIVGAKEIGRFDSMTAAFRRQT